MGKEEETRLINTRCHGYVEGNKAEKKYNNVSDVREGGWCQILHTSHIDNVRM